MSRRNVEPMNQMPAARCCSNTLPNWSTPLSRPVGGLILYGDFNTATAVNTIILDDRIDWRCRVLAISSFIEQPGFPMAGYEARPGSQGAHLIYPRARGVPTGYELSGDLFYTVNGWTGSFLDPRGGTENYNYAQWRSVETGALSNIALLYADKTTGKLLIQLKDPGTAGTFIIVASEQTGREQSLP